MQTTTTGSCQIEPFAGLSAHRRKGSRILPTPCPVCGVEFKPKSGRKYCSLKCSAIQIGKDKKGKTIDPDLIAWRKCATCHAIMGMPGKMSGDLLRKDKATICQFRKENGLPTLSKSQSTKSTLVRAGRHQAILGEQWWRDNWSDVVDSYWDRCSDTVIFKMGNPEMSYGMAYYYSDIEQSRKRSREGASKRWREAKPNSLLRIKNKLRNHVYRICKYSGTIKSTKTNEYLGCTIDQAKRHIEKQFKKGMTWANHGTVWEIDHILPLSAFDLKRKDQQMIATHFTNLRPEWKTMNRVKSNKITITHQLAFA